MDGVLIDTEPVWRRVEREVFERVGLELTDEQLRETWGLRIADLVDYWYRSRPWTGVRPKAVQREIVRAMIDHVRTHGVALPGAVEAMCVAREAGLRVAIASSSAGPLIEAVVDKLGVGEYVDAVRTADDESLGKPDPAVYRSAARSIGVQPGDCVAVEDSPFGIASAKGAGMLCIAVRTKAVETQSIAEADIAVDSLYEFTPALLSRLATLDTEIPGRVTG